MLKFCKCVFNRSIVTKVFSTSVHSNFVLKDMLLKESVHAKQVGAFQGGIFCGASNGNKTKYRGSACLYFLLKFNSKYCSSATSLDYFVFFV